MAERSLRRELSFYTIKTAKGGSKRSERDPLFNWEKFLAGLPSQKEEVERLRRQFAPLSFAILSDLPFPSLAIYRPVQKGAFVAVGPDGVSVEDLEIREGFELMNASAFFFFPSIPGLVCMLQGDPTIGSPPMRALRDFASFAVPQSTSARWVTEPVRVESQIEALRRSQGVHQLKVRSQSRTNDLFGSSPDFSRWTGFTAIANYFAKQVEGDVEVSFSVSLPREYRSDARKRRFRDVILQEVGEDGFDLSNASVRATTRRGLELSDEVLTLAAHNLATKIEIEVPEGQPVRFSQMVDEAAAHLERDGARYLELARGGTDGVEGDQHP